MPDRLPARASLRAGLDASVSHLNPTNPAVRLQFQVVPRHPQPRPRIAMPLTLEQYVERLDDRTDLPWPVAPKIDPPKARPHLARVPVRAVMWTVYGTLVAVPQGE